MARIGEQSQRDMSGKGAWKLPEHEIVPESDRSTNMSWSIVYLGSFLFPPRAFLGFPWTCALPPRSNKHDRQGELKRALVRRILGWLSRSYSVRSATFSLGQRIMEVYALQLSFRLAITCHLGGYFMRVVLMATTIFGTSQTQKDRFNGSCCFMQACGISIG